MVYLEDDKRYVVYDGNGWVDVPEKISVSTEGVTMTMYELNKNIVSQLPAIVDFDHAYEVLYNFRKEHDTTSFMLLCKDISYYTIFQQSVPSKDFHTFGEAVITCAQDIGQVIAVDAIETGSVEIWVRTPEGENLCMYLFDCQNLIVAYEV